MSIAQATEETRHIPAISPEATAPASPAALRPERLASGIRYWQWATRDPWPLLGILALQAVLALRLIWANTAFADEALYLWSGRMEIAHLVYGTQIPQFQTYFSGAPVIYPVLGAIASSYGGLAAARALSLAFMLMATLFLYGTAKILYSKKAAIYASAVFVVLGPTQVLSAFATYDAMSVCLIAGATWLAVCRSGLSGEACLVAGGLALALADATKYASGLWTPVVIVLAGLVTTRGGWLTSLLRSARLAAYTAMPLAAALFRFGGRTYIRGIMFTTVSRKAGGTPASVVDVMDHTFNWIGVVVLLAVIGTVIAFTIPWRIRWINLTLTAAAILAPAHQAQIHTLISLHKHVVFGAWFAAVAAGFTLAKAAEVNPVKGWRVAGITWAIILALAIPQITVMFVRGWPNTSAMIPDMARVLPAAGGCPCLMAEPNVVNYYLPGTSSYKIIGPYAFWYWSNPLRREVNGLPAYEQAIRDRYFRVVEIDPGENPVIYKPVVNMLRATPGYHLADIIHIPHWGRSEIQIWRLDGGR